MNYTQPTSNIYVRWFEQLGVHDVEDVGGKNASLGEMIRALKDEGVRVPDGFATTADAYWTYIETHDVKAQIQSHLDQLESGKKSLAQVGKAIRRLFLQTPFPDELSQSICDAYRELSHQYGVNEVDVAVRSSATAEDLPEASFAGQQETFLNVSGEKELLDACRRCYSSLFTNRAISYRQEKNFDHMQVALSIGVQKMVRSDKASSGVMFSIDTETGFPDVALISAAWGLGETVVQGSVNPDQYTVFKPLLANSDLCPIVDKVKGSKEKKMVYAAEGSKTTETVETSGKERQAFVLNDDEILQLARWAAVIEAHYGKPMDMEWAKDGDTGELSIVQARPETVQSQRSAGTLKTYKLKEQGKKLLTGLSIGEAIATGKVCRVLSVEDIDKVKDDSILVTEMTDPDWVPVMKRVAGIVTDYGGRTCHAAIVSRELGIPAIVGTGDATRTLKDGQEVTVSCAEGDQGNIYDGLLTFEAVDVSLEDIPDTRTQIMMNIASPSAAFQWWRLPTQGIGLARMEFIINNIIKIHPMALVHYDELNDRSAWKQIRDITKGYKDKRTYFVDRLALGISKIAASQYPNPVIVRMSDFKTNEYANLIGGSEFELKEENPMLGFRGACRYYSDRYRDGFALECQAIKRVREFMGFDNIIIMIPFCRTLDEADKVNEVLAENGLTRGENGLQVYVMCEIPSNIELADEFSKRFDGFSIGSNDLTQLVLGVDRDSGELAHLFDERNPAVERMIQRLIKTAHEAGRKVGICGQGPSDYPEFAEFLVKQGIDSMSLNPDSVIQVKHHVAETESRLA
ncbi:MAG: phosphoenolpyruvate synthase [Elainellaceae cyanobacterium]